MTQHDARPLPRSLAAADFYVPRPNGTTKNSDVSFQYFTYGKRMRFKLAAHYVLHRDRIRIKHSTEDGRWVSVWRGRGDDVALVYPNVRIHPKGLGKEWKMTFRRTLDGVTYRHETTPVRLRTPRWVSNPVTVTGDDPVSSMDTTPTRTLAARESIDLDVTFTRADGREVEKTYGVTYVRRQGYRWFTEHGTHLVDADTLTIWASTKAGGWTVLTKANGSDVGGPGLIQARMGSQQRSYVLAWTRKVSDDERVLRHTEAFTLAPQDS
ncbi:hypothetical protein [Nocardioides bruguierae]|uniref:Uncharacterized protein n=1 Tax=Nocardioides bruguierae TaxID=2945102 RepID=A0A9X2D8R6_9ACTN|nr:hypothetical protein [Nocardioides bruguierae]MCM0621420.1 hypothetical protein [Nocardioides bruguierae]